MVLFAGDPTGDHAARTASIDSGILPDYKRRSCQILRISEKHQFATTTTYVERVNLAIDHVVIHLHEPLRLRDLARAARLSPFHFHRVFQALVGATPAEFVKRLRLERALGQMARSNTPSLTSIALACGFSSSSDFSRCFRQRFHVPPSAFDIKAWRAARGDELNRVVEHDAQPPRVERLPPRHNPDKFSVKVRDVPARSVAYMRVSRPYQGDAVIRAVRRLVVWAERHELASGQWLGYQWDNPEITSLADCRYQVAVEAERFNPKGEVGRFRFPPMVVAAVEIRGGIDLELRALQWLYGSWLPRSGYVPDDQPCFEAWIGRPFAHGTEYFEVDIQLPIRRP
jgi:AraC family transcriptional regulator